MADSHLVAGELKDPGPHIPVSMAGANPGLDLRNRKILIVTDDRSKIRNLSDILRAEDYEIADVDSGDAAIEFYPRFEPDLVLLDVELPGLKAFELCRYFRNVYGGAGAAVIYIAAKSDPAEVVEGLASGGVDYLSSPFREQEVLARVRVHLLNRFRLAQLNEENRTKNRLLCMAAHDLRNPLVSIRALTHLMRAGTMGELTPEQCELLNTVYDASQSMLDLVNELLEKSVLEAREFTLNPQPTALADLVESSVRLNNATAAQKTSVIVLQPGRLPHRLLIDAPKVRQVLNNVLDNAIKFSPPGSTITVRTDTTFSLCTISVCDQGPGIREHEREKLFKDFSRGSAKPTGGESSTGLGLSICWKIMRAHGGNIRVENAPGGGADFQIIFPIDA